MTYRDAMKALKTAGTAQTRKIYGNHGVTGDRFGVSYAELGRLKRKIKQDHRLAEKLWQSGNHDARVLATMIADPATVSSATLDAWAKGLDNYVLTDAFAGFVAGTKHAPAKAKKWMKSRSEFIGQAGWFVWSGLAQKGETTDAECTDRLKEIETKIHKSPNRVRHSMNGALISIGLRNAAWEKRAVAVAKRIGKVEVDHGKTSCKTPDAVEYIKKTKAYRAKQQAKKRASARAKAR